MTTRLAPEDSVHCPFLVPVTADRLWLRPVGVFCRRPRHRVRVPADSTLARICSTHAYEHCQGYRTGAAALAGPRESESP
jgi:hypothetical protein